MVSRNYFFRRTFHWSKIIAFRQTDLNWQSLDVQASKIFNCLVTWCLFREQFFAGIANKLAITNWNTTESRVLVQFRFRNVTCSRGPLNFFRRTSEYNPPFWTSTKGNGSNYILLPLTMIGSPLAMIHVVKEGILDRTSKNSNLVFTEKVIKFKWYPSFVSVMSMLESFVLTQIQIYLNLQTCSCPQSKRQAFSVMQFK